MKQLKVLLVVIMCVLAASVGLWPGLTAEAKMYAKSAAGKTARKDVGVYESIDKLPTVVSGFKQIQFKPEHPAYNLEKRNMFLGQVVDDKYNCLITFSIPEVSNLDALDIEEYSYMGQESQRKRLLLVTAEYYAAKEKSILATSTLFVFNPEDDPTVTIDLAPGGASIAMDKIVAITYMYSMKSVSSEIWVDDYIKKPIKTAVYQSKGASMRNHKIDGWSSDKVNDAEFSYEYIDLPLDMQKHLKAYLYDYETANNS